MVPDFVRLGFIAATPSPQLGLSGLVSKPSLANWPVSRRFNAPKPANFLTGSGGLLTPENWGSQLARPRIRYA